MKNIKHNKLTILFSDIAASTQLYERIGNTRASAIINTCLELMAKTADANQGQLIKTIGDEVMCRFSIPDFAARAAISMQETVSKDPKMVTHQIQLRIGIHHGPVIEDTNDLYGDAVNLAARMVDQAKAGQIITNQLSLRKMSAEIIASARLVDQTRVKGKHIPMEIYEIFWGQPEELTMIRRLSTIPDDGLIPGKSLSLSLGLKKKRVNIDTEHPVITMGRDNGNAIVVNKPSVSRLHARIELRRSKFVLVDHSTNGTYIFPFNGPMQHIKRDEMVLEGEGIISLGKEPPSNSQMIIRYYSP